MPSPLESLKPQVLWRRFDAIRQVPRPSKREEKIVGYLRGWAGEMGFEVKSDAASNLVVAVPASPGREAAPTVALQGHVDMVCEKNGGVDFDFDREAIDVFLDGDWVRARGTTLGADNGIGLAAAMAAAEDPEVVHGPLELLFTVDEETGLNGAGALDASLVTARILLNLDSEEEGAVYIGCAGAGAVDAELAVERETSSSSPAWELALTGFAGGHSGIDIHCPRGNPVKAMAHLLLELGEAGAAPRLVGLHGGSARNALPRECYAALALDEGDALFGRIGEMSRALAERHPAEKGLQLTLVPAAEASAPLPSSLPMTPACRDRLLRVLAAAPHGVLAMSNEVEGLVETSNNLALVRTAVDAFRVLVSPRSSSNAALTETLRGLASLFELAGGRAEVDTGYPGWQPDPTSPLLARISAVHESLFGRAPEVKAVHAGLECGIFVQKLPGLDAVSFGPDLRDPHSPNERVRVASVERFYRLLGALLADLAAS